MLTELSSTDEFYFQWHLTERCNKHCSHCYQNGRLAEELPISSLEQILLHINRTLAKWERWGSISFTGGEPFLRESDLFALMNGADQINSIAFYDILTNGSLISDEIASKLKDFGKLRRIQVSLEGSTPEVNDAIRGRGSFEETLVAIRRMKKHGLTVSVMTTVSKLNYQDVPNLIELLDGEDVDTFTMERLIPEGRGEQLKHELLPPQELKELYERVYEMKSRIKGTHILMSRPLFTLVAPDDLDVGALCSVGNNALTIMPDGTVYPCRHIYFKLPGQDKAAKSSITVTR